LTLLKQVVIIGGLFVTEPTLELQSGLLGVLIMPETPFDFDLVEEAQ
jgi:hypothetical protein